MSVEETVQDSHILLEQISEEPEAVLEALDPAGQDKVIAELGVLAERTDKVQTEADLLGVADAIHRLVEDTPALAALLLPKGMDVEAERRKRIIPVSYHEEVHERSQYVQEHAPRLHNRVVDTREELERALQQFRKYSEAKEQR